MEMGSALYYDILATNWLLLLRSAASHYMATKCLC